MLHLSQLLSRFKNIGLGEKLSKEVLVEAVDKIIGPNLITISDVKIQNGVAIVRASSSIKSEIFIYKSEILKYAIEKLGKSLVINDVK